MKTKKVNVSCLNEFKKVNTIVIVLSIPREIKHALYVPRWGTLISHQKFYIRVIMFKTFSNMTPNYLTENIL